MGTTFHTNTTAGPSTPQGIGPDGSPTYIVEQCTVTITGASTTPASVVVSGWSDGMLSIVYECEATSGTLLTDFVGRAESTYDHEYTRPWGAGSGRHTGSWRETLAANLFSMLPRLSGLGPMWHAIDHAIEGWRIEYDAANEHVDWRL